MTFQIKSPRKSFYKMSPAVLLSYLYFLQGLPYGLQARFLPIYFRAHGMSLANIGYIKVLFFPWMCKTLWAPLVDHHGNKKLWLFWSMVGLGVTCIITAGIEPSCLFTLSITLLVFNFLTSTQDIATDGLAIEILTSSQVASGNIAQVVGYKCGAIIGGGLLAWLSDHISWGAIFVFMTLIYASAVIVVMIFVPEGKHYFDDMSLNIQGPQNSENKNTDSLNTQGMKNENSQESEQFDSPSRNTRSKSKHTATHNDAGSIFSTNSEKDILAQTSYSETCLQNNDTGICDVSMNRTSSVRKEDNWGLGWMRDHFANVFEADGTMWILMYVLVYKLGEQGALNMMPMFLIDGGVATADVGMWTGVIGQVVSIAGSLVGGAAITSGRYTALGFLQRLSVVKVGVLAAECVMVTSLSTHQGSLTTSSSLPCIALMLLLLSVSGAVSTSAFTLMMQCSQRAHVHCRASHYSLLATVEVLGKLMFSVFVGAITDLVGYSTAFYLFLTLSAIVLPLFWYVPSSLSSGCQGVESESNKSS